MLYVFSSEDINQARRSAQDLISKLLAKEPDSLYISLNADSFSNVSLDEITNSNALFKDKYVVFLNDILTEKENKEKFFGFIEKIQNSKHIFFLATKPLEKAYEDSLKSKSSKFIFKATNKRDKIEFNPFTVIDAMFAGNRKRMWLLFIEAERHMSIENIYGIIWWGIKNVILADKCDEKSSGLKRFVYNKAKNSKFNPKLDNFFDKVEEFVQIPARSFKNGVDMKLYIEKWILTLNV